MIWWLMCASMVEIPLRLIQGFTDTPTVVIGAEQTSVDEQLDLSVHK